MSHAVYAHSKEGKLVAFEVPDGLSNADVIEAVKEELGVLRALVLVYDADKNPDKEAA